MINTTIDTPQGKGESSSVVVGRGEVPVFSSISGNVPFGSGGQCVKSEALLVSMCRGDRLRAIPESGAVNTSDPSGALIAP